jgi:dienelactone hydrolase
MNRTWLTCTLMVLGSTGYAGEKSDLSVILGKPLLRPKQSMSEAQVYVDARTPRLRAFHSAAEWNREAERLRAEVLAKTVYRGEGAAWRDATLGIKWLETIAGGPGYRIKKLRYEALPGLWIPALLYEPEALVGKVPAILNVNGHDPKGKAAEYKQIRCINLAKRGMLALNLEWLGMGQLRSASYEHGRMNQLDLCGTSGLAPFFLCMKRGLDVLLAQPHADPERVAVTGLSGGGWQTIYISSLDTRVKLTNPVAGYSSNLTRLHHFKDLGDSEQTPNDMATVADYTHLTALMAPRPTLLTYNDKDDCCFESGYALPPLLEAAGPFFKLFGKPEALRSHVNSDPGTHNYEKDNRQAFYRMVGDFFYAKDTAYSPVEIPCTAEVKTPEQLSVELPPTNANFNSLALALSKSLPRSAALPADSSGAKAWQTSQRSRLRELVAAKDFPSKDIRAEKVHASEEKGTRVVTWRLKLADTWTVPVVELSRGQPRTTSILLNDAGRRTDPVNAERLLAAGHRVLAIDLFYFGEAQIGEGRDYLFALLIATIGDRPMGLQASQLAAVARWAQSEYKCSPLTVTAVGPRMSTVALVAAALEESAIRGLELHGSLGSLKEILESNRSLEHMPELFCFGLLEWFDIKQLAALVAPRPVIFVTASARLKQELSSLKDWYRLLGAEFDPVR